MCSPIHDPGLMRDHVQVPIEARPGSRRRGILRPARSGRPLAIIVGLFVVMQLVPYRVHDPTVIAEPNWDSPQTRDLAVRACFGCHSNQTEKPWYASVAPMAWLVNNHVEGGREALNFSEWTPDQARQANKIDRVIRTGSMPPSSYTWFGLHSESKLTPAETDALLAGLQATLANSR
jgi:hypothetical protein